MKHMRVETFPLSAEDESVTLTAYIAADTQELPYNQKRPGILVCPGGAYAFISDRENEPIALAFLANGYNAFCLTYTVNNRNHRGKKFPAQLLEAAQSMKFIKDHAEEFCVDPERIFVIGFSAGGHLAGSLGTMYNSDYVKAALDMPENYARPLGMLLCYPVISGGEYAHRGSFDNILLDERESEEARDRVSLEKCVDENTVPTFIWHTRPDATVSVQNSLLFASALAAHGVGFEMHIFPYGGHGAALATDLVGWNNPTIATWFERALAWMKTIQPKEEQTK